VRTEIATGSVWQRLQRLVVGVGAVGGGGGESFREGILFLLLCFALDFGFGFWFSSSCFFGQHVYGRF
jgi:hypothetical protein